MAGGAGKPGFAPRLQTGLEQVGLCLGFPMWVFFPRERCAAGRKPLKEKKKEVFVYSAKRRSGSQLRTVPANWKEESMILFAYYGPSNAGLTHGCEHSKGAGSVDSPDVPHPGGNHLLDLDIFFSKR